MTGEVAGDGIENLCYKASKELCLRLHLPPHSGGNPHHSPGEGLGEIDGGGKDDAWMARKTA